MMELYHEASLACSRQITHKYSTSFGLAVRTLSPLYRDAVYAVYGFVRLADEIVDSFHDHPKARLLADFRQHTYMAIDDGISINPVLHSFQKAANRFGIERELTDAFLDSMEMDLNKVVYDRPAFDTYIYGSAEVVGLMCLRIFCKGDNSLYESLKEPARMLGSAFQKVNFLRDMKSDTEALGRMYFPGVDFSRFSDADKKEIEKEIGKDFKEAYKGIVRLPAGARFAVYLAYRYYYALFLKISGMPASRIREARIRISNAAKYRIIAAAWVRNAVNLT